MWQPYKRGMAIVGRYMRIAGPPGNYIEVRNVDSGQPCRLTSGLVGKCESEVPQHARITFSKHLARQSNSNENLWAKNSGLTHGNNLASFVSVDVIPSKLLAFEVGDLATDLKASRGGTAMGVRG